MSGNRVANRMNRLSSKWGNLGGGCGKLKVVVGGLTSEKVRVVVGDDHPMFRDGVVRALTSSGFVEVVAEADDGATALEAIRTHLPQVALLDYRMPGMDGAEVAAAVTRDELPTRVLLLSAHDESAIVYKALQEGAAGFLPKESTRSELVTAVLDCAKGRDVVAPSLAAGLAGEIRKRAEPDGPVLSPREREVLKMIADGSSIPAMAKQMFLAPSTVKTHVQRLYEKLGVSDRGAAVAEAMRRKLLE
jgi:two-component system, NarL family, nitrate/nitrite response regulator NarL